MALPLLDPLCCCLCAVSFPFLMLVYIQVHIKPASYLIYKAASLASLNSTPKMGWKIQFVVCSVLSFPLSFWRLCPKEKKNDMLTLFLHEQIFLQFDFEMLPVNSGLGGSKSSIFPFVEKFSCQIIRMNSPL